MRRGLRLSAPRWRSLKQAAAAQGLTASALIAAIYSEILAAWSRRARFSLTLTQFAAPPDMVGVVGDFTSTILLEVDSTSPHFRDRARMLQRRLLTDLDHGGFSGVAVLRELRRQRPDFAPVSVVFTSTLSHPGLDPDAPSPLAWLGTASRDHANAAGSDGPSCAGRRRRTGGELGCGGGTVPRRCARRDGGGLWRAAE